jgi:hypothetical protein
MTASLVSLMPICLIYSLIFLICWYKIMKFTFLRRTSVKVNVGIHLSKMGFDTLEYMIPLFAIGNTIFYAYTFEGK